MKQKVLVIDDDPAILEVLEMRLSTMGFDVTATSDPRKALEDFDKADCVFIFGQNPGTNSPRMITNLRDASRRGAAIISFNPFRERALERFQHPQSRSRWRR